MIFYLNYATMNLPMVIPELQELRDVPEPNFIEAMLDDFSKFIEEFDRWVVSLLMQ